MIYQAAAALLISMNLAGGDTPIEPIDSGVVTLVIMTSDRSQEICDQYPDFVAGIDLAVDDYALSQEIVDAWAFSLIEEGYDPSGNSRLTVEARAVVTGWLHNCPTPFQP
jgi:hypothetical protein